MNSKAPVFSILVNSSDGFEDCWGPFFTLFSLYWPHCRVPILLNTETKIWNCSSIELQCTRVEKKSGSRHKLTWSECLMEALAQVQTPLVLYLQEDYFFERPVNEELIYEFSELMIRDRRIKHIGLTHFGSMGPFEITEDPRLWSISKRSRYRISTQAGLWCVSTLKSYLRSHENGWMFEIFGTRRARRRDEVFLTANRTQYCPEATPIIQYAHTGIVKGKWNPAIVPLFGEHGIKIDFTKRGISNGRGGKMQTLIKLISNPGVALRALIGR